MDFMTSGTMRNMPAYLNDQRKRQEVYKAEQQQIKAEEIKRQERQRQRELGYALYELEDKSPKGLQRWAMRYEVTPEELEKLAPLVSYFKIQREKGSGIDKQGNKVDFLYDPDNPDDKQILSTTGMYEPPTQQGLLHDGSTALFEKPFGSGDYVRSTVDGGGPLRTKPSLEEQLRLKAAGAPSITNQITDDSLTALGKEQGKTILTEREDAMGAVSSLENIQEARKLLDGGMITGTGAEFLTSFGNFLSSRLGIDFAEDPVANTQTYAATMGKQVGQIIKQFGSGTGLSDADREYAEKIVGGKVTLTEKALRKLIDINERAFTNVVKNYNIKADQIMSKPGADNLLYDLRIDAPEAKPKKKFEIISVD